MVFFRTKPTKDKDYKNAKHLKKECTNLVSDDIIPLSDGKIIVSGGKIPVTDENIPLPDGKIIVSGGKIPVSDEKIIWSEIKKSKRIVGFKKNSSYIFFVK